MPAVFEPLEQIYQRLEAHYRDMQDIEFTVQRGSSCCRPAAASVRPDLEDRRRPGRRTDAPASEAVGCIEMSLDQLLHPTLDPEAERRHRQGAAGQSGRGQRRGGVHRRRGRDAAPPARR